MASSAKQLRIAGAVVLIVGTLAAVSIYFTARSHDSAAILGVDIRTNRDRLQLERMGGKSYVALKDFDDWFASLWHGRRLGYTVGVLCLLGFLLCRALAYAEDDLSRSEVEGRTAKGPGA